MGDPTKASNAIVATVDFYAGELAASERENRELRSTVAMLTGQLKSQSAQFGRVRPLLVAARALARAMKGDDAALRGRCEEAFAGAVDLLDASKAEAAADG